MTEPTDEHRRLAREWFAVRYFGKFRTLLSDPGPTGGTAPKETP